MPPKLQWPTLGRVSQNHHEHGILLINECKQLQQLVPSRTAAIHDFAPLFDSVINFIEFTQQQPLASQILAEIQTATRKLTDIDSKIIIIKHTTEAPPAPPLNAPVLPAQTWAQLAANNASTITRPAYKDREITVKLTNPEAVQVLRGLNPVELRKRINQYIKNFPETTHLAESITAVS
jgi:hypothetical protein